MPKNRLFITFTLEVVCTSPSLPSVHSDTPPQELNVKANFLDPLGQLLGKDIKEIMVRSKATTDVASAHKTKSRLFIKALSTAFQELFFSIIYSVCVCVCVASS